MTSAIRFSAGIADSRTARITGVASRGDYDGNKEVALPLSARPDAIAVTQMGLLRRGTDREGFVLVA